MKKIIALILALVMVFALVACGNTGSQQTGEPAPTQGTEPAPTGDPAPTQGTEPSTEPKSVGFVGFGPGDFFDMLSNAYLETMKAEGWEAHYTSGNFDPPTQIAAAENYIAMGVDVLVIWSVAPEAMGSVIDTAMAQGIKVIAFVAETAKYDATMLSLDDVLAGYCAKLAAKWVDEAYANAPNGSVDVAVFSCRAAETGVVQADVLLKMAEYSSKIGTVTEVECEDEQASTGMTKMENLYTTNPEIKLFLSAHNGLAQGIANYFTGINSPVTDYSDMGIFCINGDTAVYDMIKASTEGKNPLRGTVMTGGVQDTANELRDVIVGLMDGTYESGYKRYSGTLFVYDETIDEFLSTGTVTSVSNADFD